MGVIVLQRIHREWTGLVPLSGGVGEAAASGGCVVGIDGDTSSYRPAAAAEVGAAAGVGGVVGVAGVRPSPCSTSCACPQRQWCSGSHSAVAVADSADGGSIGAVTPPQGLGANDCRESDGADGLRDAGMSTVEYAVGTVVAAAFAAVLYRIVTGDSVVSGLTNLINSALSTSF